ncbi:MAG: hypothetical protein ABSC41_20255 [Acidimicrobiales bacterium]
MARLFRRIPVLNQRGSILAFALVPLLLLSLTPRAGASEQTSSTKYSGTFWQVRANGQVYGDHLFGSMAGHHLNQPIVGMAPTSDSRGYWLVASDGGVFGFGSAPFFGSMAGQHLNQPIVGITPTPDGGGYWLVASDGGVFGFGDASFHGSMAGTKLDGPIVGIAATSSGNGYWLDGSDGGVFAFGSATFFGSVAEPLGAHDVVGPLVPTPDQQGYWLASSSNIGPLGWGFGDAVGCWGNGGVVPGTKLPTPYVGAAIDELPEPAVCAT